MLKNYRNLEFLSGALVHVAPRVDIIKSTFHGKFTCSPLIFFLFRSKLQRILFLSKQSKKQPNTKTLVYFGAEMGWPGNPSKKFYIKIVILSGKTDHGVVNRCLSTVSNGFTQYQTYTTYESDSPTLFLFRLNPCPMNQAPPTEPLNTWIA